MQDRPYQSLAEEATIKEYDKGIRRMLHVMATGTGKTIVIGKLFEKLRSRLPGQMLVVAHTEELVEQNREKIQDINPTLKVGKEMAGAYADIDSDIFSASVQTLGRKGTKRVERFNWSKIDKVVIDEAHHATTDGYNRILNCAGSLANDTSKLLLGVTATPNRPDGSPLSDVFEKVAFVYSMRDAIRDGWLVDIKGWRVKTDTSLDGVGHSEGDFVSSELARTVNTPGRNLQIVETWMTKGENRQTLAFTVDIQHAKDLATTFEDAGIPSAAIWGDDPDRAEKLRLHREGKIRVLCNCAVLTEGYDDWHIGCVILARPTKSAILFTQMVGRATRLDPNFGNLKQISPASLAKWDCIILDIVDGSSKHSLVTLPTLMGLQACLDLRGKSLLWAVETLEKLKEENPTVDFSKLLDIGEAKAVIEAVDLFQVRFPPEVEANSELIWFKAVDGGYKMLVPKEGPERTGFVRIFENALGRWEIIGEINGEDFHGTRNSIEEIFKVGDEQVRKRVTKHTLGLIKREATWHNKPVTKGQIKMIERLFPHKKFLYEQMTSGAASRLISERFARKATR